MGGLSIWHWLVVALVILVLFGRGKISEMMGDFGKGIRSFKKGLAEDDAAPPASPPPPASAPPPQIASPPADAAPAEPARERDTPST